VDHQWRQLQKELVLWMRKSEDVTSDDYASFYSSLSHDWKEKLSVKHFSIREQLEFRAFLFVLRRVPFRVVSEQQESKQNEGHVRRVYTDDRDELIPEWFNFVGVVLADDLPLRFSRETLPQGKERPAKTCLGMFAGTAEEDAYRKFDEQFEPSFLNCFDLTCVRT